MKTRTLVPTSELECRCRNRMHKAEGCMDTYQHVRAELQRVARQVRKLKRECLPAQLRCHDEADFIEAYNRALADVLDLIREAQR